VFTHRIRSPRAGSARSAGRWVGLVASALVTGTGLLALPTTAPIASADNCSDAEVVFARGTNEPPGMGKVGDAFVDSLRQQTGGMNITTYGVNYAASKLQLHGGDGANDVINHVKKTASDCPNTKIVLGGYSQGASVMDIVAGVPIGGINFGSPLPSDLASHVVAVATFGDIADRAGGSLPAQSAMFGSKAIDLCNPNDPICHAGQGNEWSGHTEGYVPVYTTQAAAFVASKLLAGSGQQVPGYGPQIPGYGPQTPGYGPQTPGYGPQTPGYGPQTPGYGPQTPGYGPQTPGYAPQQPGSGPSIHEPAPTAPAPAPTSPTPAPDLVSAIH
jgi:trehalose dimycolate hydrolase